MSILNQNNSEIQDGIAVAESCVFYGTGSLKLQLKCKNITICKRKDSQLRTGLAMSCLKRVQRELRVMEV
jgi:hypothetical protein